MRTLTPLVWCGRCEVLHIAQIDAPRPRHRSIALVDVSAFGKLHDYAR